MNWGARRTAVFCSLVSVLAAAPASAQDAGLIMAWGRNYEGQCNVPVPNTDFAAVSSGGDHSLGLRSDGSIVAWGYNYYGQCNVPAPNSAFVAVAAGGQHSLGLRADGSIVGWGENSGGQCNVPTPNADFVAVAAGGGINGGHSLGVKSNGSIVAWGGNYYGQCTVPWPNSDFVGVAGGGDHSLGLRGDGSIVAWGRNTYGQCNVPTPNSGFVAVAGGGSQSLGLKADGSIVAWGSVPGNPPVPNSDFVAIAAGGGHSLGLKADGSIVAWGSNNSGQCNVPAPNSGFVAVAGGGSHSLGLLMGTAGVIYVDNDAPLGGNGSSWNTAFAFLQDALMIAVSGAEIRAAQGAHKPDRDAAHPNGTGSKSASFQFRDGVTLRGGYAGYGAPDPDARDVVLYETTLSGDLAGDDGPNFANYSENSSYIVTVGSSQGSAALDGVTIRSADSDGLAVTNPSQSTLTLTNCRIITNRGGGTSYSGSGMNLNIADSVVSENGTGGVSCTGGTITGCTIANNVGPGAYLDGSPAITGCTITGNTGGGVSSVYGSPTITGCTISGNSGSGVSSSGGSATIVGCTISGNSAATGGGVSCSSGSLTITDCVVVSNLATGIASGGLGGGIYLSSGWLTAVNCLFARNIATNDGGGAYFYGIGTLVNCTITENFAIFFGGGLCANDGSVYVHNGVLWNNAGALGQELALVGAPVVRVGRSDVMGNYQAAYVDPSAALLWGWGNIDADPLFVDAGGDNFRLSAGSPCIDAADNFAVSVLYDLDGNPRMVDDPNTPDTGLGEAPLADLGAYEFQPRTPTIPGDLNCDGQVDFDDINAFVLALSDPAAYATAYPACNILNGDCDADGDVDFGDINAFVALLSGR